MRIEIRKSKKRNKKSYGKPTKSAKKNSIPQKPGDEKINYRWPRAAMLHAMGGE
jgi:hypothetical protein